MVINPIKSNQNLRVFADGTVKLSGGDEVLRTSTSIRDSPDRGEEQGNLRGESDGSPPPFQDSLPDDGEARNDFRSISGNYIYRHHVEPTAKLYMPKEESFPIPMKYIDVTRTTHTSLDVLLEKNIGDYWNMHGERELSDAWTGFTRFVLLNERPQEETLLELEDMLHQAQTCLSVCRRRQCPIEQGDLLEIDWADPVSTEAQKHRLGLCSTIKKSKQKLEFREAHQRSLTEMEELWKFQSSTFDTMARRKLVEDQNTILGLSGPNTGIAKMK